MLPCELETEMEEWRIEELRTTLKERLSILIKHFNTNLSDDEIDKRALEMMNMIDKQMKELKNATT